jgi:hypothetical protein
VVLNEPKPGHATLSPALARETTTSKNASTVRSASAFDVLACSATASISSALVMLVLYLLGTGTKVSAYPTTRAALKQASR